MAFSLTLTDLNDYLGPSQACIKPVETKTAGLAETEIVIDGAGVYEVGMGGTSQKLEKAEVNLSDCLACSGCITSAESVLINMQTVNEVETFLASNSGRTAVLSIAPQSLAALVASTGNASMKQMLCRVEAFARSLGFAHTFDTTYARDLVLQEHIREFAERKASGRLPMVASACPGWVCYAEKAHHDVLPFIAETKSPQQAMGAIVRRIVDENVYHVCVMPCYDKKLEASRDDAVDCVLTTGELVQLMKTRGFDYGAAVDEGQRKSIVPDLVLHRGSSSGSYLMTVAKSIGGEIVTRRGRSKDQEDVEVRVDGQTVFRGTRCYGLRHLRAVVGKIKRRAYDYVEVMACPGGCVNGGGQPANVLEAVEEAYWDGAEQTVEPIAVDLRTTYTPVAAPDGLRVQW